MIGLRFVHGFAFPCRVPKLNAIYFHFGDSIFLILGDSFLLLSHTHQIIPLPLKEKYGPCDCRRFMFIAFANSVL